MRKISTSPRRSPRLPGGRLPKCSEAVPLGSKSPSSTARANFLRELRSGRFTDSGRGTCADSPGHKERLHGIRRAQGLAQPKSAPCAQAFPPRRVAPSCQACREGSSDPAMTREDDRRRTIFGVVRDQLGCNLLDCVNGEVNRKRRPRRSIGREGFIFRHGRGAPLRARQNERLRNLRQGELSPKCGRCGGKGRNAWRNRIGDGKSFEHADLLAHRAPNREIAGVEARNIIALAMSTQKFFADFFEAHWRRVDDPCSLWAIGEERLWHERARVKTDP